MAIARAGEYDEELNLILTGFGPGFNIYEVPSFLGGGAQLNIDRSVQEISPQVILDGLKNPQWALVALALVLIAVVALKK